LDNLLQGSHNQLLFSYFILFFIWRLEVGLELLGWDYDIGILASFVLKIKQATQKQVPCHEFPLVYTIIPSDKKIYQNRVWHKTW